MKVRPEKREMKVREEERERRTEGGRKEVGLARAMEREERTRSQPSERERETERRKQRDGKVGGRDRLRERNREESEAFGSFLSRILSLWLSGAFPPLEKLSLFLCLSFPPPRFFSDSIFLSLSVHFSQTLCNIFHVLSFLSLSQVLSLFLSFSLSFPSSVFLSPCLKFFSASISSPCHTFCPSLRPPFDGLHSLPSSSSLLQPLFSQDASLQGVLHQDGTETEREGVGVWSHARF